MNIRKTDRHAQTIFGWKFGVFMLVGRFCMWGQCKRLNSLLLLNFIISWCGFVLSFVAPKKKHTNTHSHNLQPNEVDACYACVFRPSISEWLWFWDTFASGTRYFEYVNDNKTEDPHTSCACVCWTLALIVYVLSVSKNVKLPQLSHLSYVIS